MLRVVVDTNVLIEGEKDPHSYQTRIMRLAVAGELTALVSPDTAREYQRLIRRLVVSVEYRALVEQFLESTEQVEPTISLAGATEDSDDDKFLELAKDGDADYIITRDRHLLDVERLGDIEITTPERFWNTFHEVARSAVRALGY